MQTTSSQPRAIYYVVALQIWEYFSFYGIRALSEWLTETTDLDVTFIDIPNPA